MADHHSPAPATTPQAAHAAPDGHASPGHGDYLHHVRPYLLVGAALFVFTIITVGLSYVRFEDAAIFRWVFAIIGIHGHGINITIGLIVAAFKVCLVGAWFMHLKSEKGEIWRPLIFTFIFCFGLFALFLLAHSDPIYSTIFTQH